MRRFLILIVSALCLTIGVLAGPAAAQTEPTESTVSYPEGGGILPRPNSGVAPQDPGDRGGSLQSAVFVIVLAGVGVIGWLVVRESRKARAERGF